MTSLGHHSKTSPSTGSSEFLFHEPCEECGSSDAKSVYDDGHTYCFVCHHYTHGDGEPSLHIHQTKRVQITGSAQRLQKRNISQKVCEKYKIYRDGDKLRFYYHDESGIVKGAKVKTKGKQFSYEGEVTRYILWTTSYTLLLVNVSSSLKARWMQLVVLSVCRGGRWFLYHRCCWCKEGDTKTTPLLQGYDEIVIFYDNDDQVVKPLKSVLVYLPPGKVKIA